MKKAASFIFGSLFQRRERGFFFRGSHSSLLRSFQMGLGALLIFFGVLTLSHSSSFGRSLSEGTFFLTRDVSGYEYDEARAVVHDLIRTQSVDTFLVQVIVDGELPEERAIAFESLGLRYDEAASVDQLFEQSSIGFMAQLLQQDEQGDEQERVFYPLLDMNTSARRALLKEVQAFQKATKDAEVNFSVAEGWKVVPEQIGLVLPELEQNGLLLQLEQYSLNSHHQLLLPLHFSLVQPELKEADLAGVLSRIRTYTEKTIRWERGGSPEELSVSRHPEFLEVDAEKGTVEPRPEALEAYIQAYAGQYDSSVEGHVAAAAPSLQADGSMRSVFAGSFERSRLLDKGVFYERLVAALEAEGAEQEIELVWEDKVAEVALEGVGVLSLLAEGRSSYRLGNQEDRVFNIKKGLGKYDGTVIPVGAEFSFNQILGYVRYEDGWRPALAIFGGGGVRPVPGGGLCQVSTTMYRAAINSGLPITSRRPHSLDVSYYHEYGDGIDSTIYPPEDIDLKFVNDTPGPIFIHAYTDNDAEEAIVEFYGIDDGRSVELEQVANRPVNLQREVVYTADLPVGVQEVTKPRTGRYIEYKMTVRGADGSEDIRSIETLYPARRMMVRIGTGGAKIAQH